MTYRIEHIKARIVVGMKTNTTAIRINESTKQIAQRFMPRRSEVQNRIGNHVLSIQNYGSDYNPSDITSEFEKWVAVEVSGVENMPSDMEEFIIGEGTYAVFNFKGALSDFPKSRAFIFGEWLPNSGYRLAQNPHFEIMNEDYSKDLSNVEEDIWIPIIKA